jgi:hypothetical protein
MASPDPDPVFSTRPGSGDPPPELDADSPAGEDVVLATTFLLEERPNAEPTVM